MLKKILLVLFITLIFIIPAAAQAQSQSLSLKEGFNFVSFTLKPTLTPLQFKSQNPSINEIYSYSASAGSFLSVSEGTVMTLSAGKGYIIKTSAASTITVAGTSVSTIGPVSLKAGFNLVGISKTVAADKFSDIMKNNSAISGIYKWSASSGSFIQVIRNLSGIADLLDGLDPTFASGQSYFMNLKSDTTLDYDGGSLVFGGGSPTVTKVATPVVTPAGGAVTNTTAITITCATSGATIKYTADGSTPSSSNGNTYSAPFSIVSSQTFKVAAIKSGMTDSDVVTAAFTIGATQPPAGGASVTVDLGGGVSIEMMKISAGTFQMGDAAVSAASPAHSVTISKDYYISKYEVTQGQWTKIMGSNPSLNKTGDNYPVETVSWNDCQSFIMKMNQSYSSYGTFKLPTEAEWEYAARGGTATSYYWGGLMNSLYAWYGEGGTGKHHAVGQKQPNAFGLYDVTGNVWEFCSDYYSTYTSGAVTDPSGPASGASVPIRGASYYDNESESRIANRHDVSLTLKQYNIGFRLALSAGQIPVQTKVETPAISPNGGTFTSAQQVSITCATSGATIKYTTDGSTPSATVGTTYSAAITISSTTTIKAVAIKTGSTESSVAAATFTINTIQPPVGGASVTVDLGGGVSIEMIKISAGTFQMGDTNAGAFGNESPVHSVTITKDFYIGKYELTQKQWTKVMGTTPYTTASFVGDNNPVYSVSWNDCQSFTSSMNSSYSTYGTFRLPTEAEWEYACRAGSTTSYYWGATVSDGYLWYSANSGSRMQSVGGKTPNAWGLYDMSGNAMEWCSDWAGENYYSTSPGTDPQGPVTGTYRIVRGGGYGGSAGSCRSGYRSTDKTPTTKAVNLGFRLCLTPSQTQPQTKAAAPVIAPNGGTFTAAQQVTITCATSGATIKYTTDGSTPSATVGTAYSSAFTVSATTTVKAVAIKTGMTDSDITSATFTISGTQPPAGGQTLSIDLGGGVKLEMVKISAGTFQMGDPETGQIYHEYWHKVTLTKDFYIGRYEVTQGQWKAIMNGANPSYFKTGDNYPVETVSWNDICQTGGYLEKINALKPGGYSGFRLPTEAEWEYSCRAGTATSFYWGADIDGNYCWYSGNSGNTTHPVGAKQPNAWGIYDMSGNVRELCGDYYAGYDWYAGYSASVATVDPVGPPSTWGGGVTAHVDRGGNWEAAASECRSFNRQGPGPTYKRETTGFRIVLPVQ